jgi:hypothetical protein
LEAYGPGEGPSVVSLRALLGLIGAHEWRIKGIEIAAIGGRIHPHYGVFAPIRHEYVDLVATAPLPDFRSSSCVAFDIGTGTGVLAAVLARRGMRRVVAVKCFGRQIPLSWIRCTPREQTPPLNSPRRVPALAH